jgi:excinuclease ABC subunit A
LEVIETLINKGNSVIIIEHNMDVIKKADYIVDLGPEGGKNGGEMIFQGFIDRFLDCKSSVTADFLKKELT